METRGRAYKATTPPEVISSPPPEASQKARAGAKTGPDMTARTLEGTSLVPLGIALQNRGSYASSSLQG